MEFPYSAVPTTEGGIDFRSDNEYRYSRWLRREFPNGWEFEPRRFRHGPYSWRPDFRLKKVKLGRTFCEAYIELKHQNWWDSHSSEIEKQLANVCAIFDSKPDALVLVVVQGLLPRRVTLEEERIVLTEMAWVRCPTGLVLVEPVGIEWTQ